MAIKERQNNLKKGKIINLKKLKRCRKSNLQKKKNQPINWLISQ